MCSSTRLDQKTGVRLTRAGQLTYPTFPTKESNRA